MKGLIRKKLRLEHWHKIAIFMILYDAIMICGAYTFALFCRFDFQYSQMMEQYGRQAMAFLPLYTAGSIIIYQYCKLYKSIWRFSSLWEVEHASAACAASFLYGIVISIAFGIRLPISVYIIGIVFQAMFTLMLRFAFRFILVLRSMRPQPQAARRKAMLIGAGSAGQMLLHDTKKPDSALKICCMIDDNANKHHRFIDGVEVIGGRNRIKEAAVKYGIETIIFAIPSACAADKKEILEICQQTGCDTKILPSILDIASSKVEISDLKSIQMEDLLGREPVQVDNGGIYSSLRRKTVLVTGGGGSIGSELCRQIAQNNPARLIIVDCYENSAYEIQNELKRNHPELVLDVIIASVRDSRRISALFAHYRPEIVFHAAAYKHVPLMENAPCEAIKNNVFGTYKVAKAALEYGSERFVLISTDKAVRPTNIMGASKRLCEMIIQTMNEISSGQLDIQLPEIDAHSNGIRFSRSYGHTQFVAVRFGNVLGSNGSVIPLFTRQIQNHGPVTVTHPDIIRYFMTIPEAVSLVLQAGIYARGGEIFVLDMGDPVKIDDLARKLIRLSGYTPDVDIKIEYTGLRLGEKLFEEKLMAEEGLEKTPNELIHIGKPVSFDRAQFLNDFPDLYHCAMRNDHEEVILETARLVQTYTPDWQNFERNHLVPRDARHLEKNMNNGWLDLETFLKNSTKSSQLD